MKIHVFYKIDQNPGLRNQVEAPLSVRAELEKLRNELSLAKNENEKKITLRKIARLERFEKLTEQSGENTEAIGKILKGKTSESYLGSDLLSLKKRGVDIAALILVSATIPEQDLSGAKIDVGNKLIVNFGTNKQLNANIGAGDILSAEISMIRVNGVEGVRKNTPRPGYYAHNKYLPIFDGDTIEIVKKGALNEGEREENILASENRWKHQRASDMIDYNGKNPLTDLPEDTALFSEVTKVAQERETIKKKYERELLGFEKITPGSEACINLFKDACKSVGIDQSWASDKSLHEILQRESGGYIGRLNYTLGDMSLGEFKEIALKGNRVPARSSASGLGQLLLDNVDKYYPSGRAGIGNPLEEAVGMIKYIQDRYGDPTTAMNIYGKTGSYRHATTGIAMSKSFQEGY